MRGIFVRQKRALGDTPQTLVPTRSGSLLGPQPPSTQEAMRSSAMWAALSLRADLVSTFPVQLYRISGGIAVELPLTQFLQTPGALFPNGPLTRMDEWLYASQMDLDRFGNCFGIIMNRDYLGNATRVDLVDASTVVVRVRSGVVTYVIGGQPYGSDQVWHERQYLVPGTPVGLNPIGYAVLAMNQGLTASQFAAQWFSTGGIPSAVLKNTARTLDNSQAAQTKQRVKETLASGDVFVTGKDWDYQMVSVPANQAAFIEAMNCSEAQTVRFFGVPGELVGVAMQGSSVTYANITQRNLEFLIMKLNPAVTRRELALTAATPRPWQVNLDTDVLLRMDPSQQATVNGVKVDHFALTPDEWRASDNRPPLTEEDMAQLGRVKGAAAPQTQKASLPKRGRVA